ncbi:hypothetical protein LIER_32999 [Lithospermum erythrorhizon]|uniref:Uncharacterized protein n=1 Tax=Lithospermum erythrorhizon TaxID=34254 RepID=A0AAV3S166_LITER
MREKEREGRWWRRTGRLVGVEKEREWRWWRRREEFLVTPICRRRFRRSSSMVKIHMVLLEIERVVKKIVEVGGGDEDGVLEAL